MTAVLECPFKTDNVFLVVWVSLFEFIEDLHLLEPCPIPAQEVSFHPEDREHI
jgi:hypothetical protein